jgi:Pyruvate/2-oxoacid:ferredoxin oxidoreductase gamma subunit
MADCVIQTQGMALALVMNYSERHGLLSLAAKALFLKGRQALSVPAMFMISALCAKSRLLTLEDAVKGMEAALKGKEKILNLNRKGIEGGFYFVTGK